MRKPCHINQKYSVLQDPRYLLICLLIGARSGERANIVLQTLTHKGPVNFSDSTASRTGKQKRILLGRKYEYYWHLELDTWKRFWSRLEEYHASYLELSCWIGRSPRDSRPDMCR